MTKRQYLISGVLTLLILLIGAFAFQRFKAQKESTVSDKSTEETKSNIRLVETASFTSATLPSKIDIDGRVSAYEQINIMPEVTGKLLPANKTYKTGSYFEKGDLLFNIEKNDETYSLYAQRSTLLNAITQIMPDLKFDYPSAFTQWDNYLQQFSVEKNTAPLPTAQTDSEKYFIAGKNIYNLYYTIKAQEDRLKNHQIYAPFSGVMLNINAFPGSLVSPGMTLANIMNTSRYEMIAPVAMDKIAFIKPGQQLTLSSSVLDKTYKGTVQRVSRQIDQSTQSVPVYISVQGTGLKDGIFLEGTLQGNALKDVVEIPRDIMLDQEHIYIVQDDQVAKKAIEIVSRTDESLMVKGIDPSDKVVIAGINNLYVGQQVNESN